MSDRNAGVLEIAKTSAESATALFFDPVRRFGLFRPLFRESGGGLSVYGRLVVFATPVILGVALIWAQIINLDAGKRRVRELLDALYSQTGQIAMTTPPRPTLLPDSPVTDKVRVVSPANNAVVGAVEAIEGTAPEGDNVWIVIHPVDTSSYWVQPRPSVGNGKWQATTYLGRTESVDAGKKFEVRAILDPRIDLKEGQVLGSWPEAKAVSMPVILQRR
jgi:hypothetical protein